MKRIALFIAAMFLLACFASNAQQYEPRDSWPYVYENFVEGVVSTGSDDAASAGHFNVVIFDGSLMYIGKDGNVMSADMSRVNSARLGSDIYINIRGKLYLIQAAVNEGLVLLGKELDQDKLDRVNIGYGVSSATSSDKNIVVLLSGRMHTVTRHISQSEKEKYDGMVLPVRDTRYLYVKGHLIPATKSEVLSTPGLDKKAAKAFMKKEKIRWKDASSLSRLVVFIHDNI